MTLRVAVGREIVLADGREDLDRDGVGEDRRAVLHVAGDRPTVAGQRVERLVADRQPQVPADEIARLLLRVGVVSRSKDIREGCVRR